MPDAPLLALVAKCAAARRAQEEALDRLEAACVGRVNSTMDVDSELIILNAVYQAADVELDALYLAVSILPSHTVEGALAKASVLPDEGDLEKGVVFLVRRFAEGLQKATDRPVDARR
jgi:hypothetical protein